MKEINKVFDAYENETFALKLERDVILVDGPDAGKYLQGQLTQDVLGMKEGESVWSSIAEVVEASGGRVIQASTEHDAGKQLEGMGGAIALLRWKLE